MSVSGIGGVSYLYTNSDSANEIADLIMKYQGQYYSPVFYAAKANDLYAVEKLLSVGGNLDYALRGAITGNHIELMKYLVEVKKAPIQSSIDTAVDLEQWMVVDYLIEQGATAPSPISYLKRPDVLRELMARGAKFTERDGIPTRQFAEIFGKDFDRSARVSIFESLTKDCGLKINTAFDVYENGASRNYTPILFALLNNDLKLAKAILNLGVDVNEHNSWYARIATSENNKAMLALLISYGAKIQ